MYHALGQRVWFMLWLRHLATGPSVQRPRFIECGICGGLSGLGADLSVSTSFLPSHCHST